MRVRRLPCVWLAAALSAPMLPLASAQTPAGTAFSYQGRLTDGGSPATGQYDLEFGLCDNPNGDVIFAGPIAIEDQQVTHGLFTVKLDFGVGAFTGNARWLKVGVRPYDDTGPYTYLAPLQELTPTPYALYALNGGGSGVSFWAAQGDHIHNTNAGNVGIGATSPGSPLTVAGAIESTAGGFKFPDGSAQTSAAYGATASVGPRTPLQIALLRWYDAMQSGLTFTTGSHSVALAFDGANIWCANLGSNSVTKIRASDGSQLGTYTVGSTPAGIAFDGASIWVANKVGNNVTRLRASDGTTLGTYAVGHAPVGVAFDGKNMWVVNSSDNNVTKLRASDGQSQGTYNVGAVPCNVAFDGANVWVTNGGDGTVTKLRATNGALLGTYDVGNDPQGVAFDGTNVWVANNDDGTVTKLRAADGAQVGTYPVGTNPTGVVFDGTNIWVGNYTSGDVTKLRASDGSVLGTFPVVDGGRPQGLAFDGANVWVANYFSKGVSKL